MSSRSKNASHGCRTHAQIDEQPENTMPPTPSIGTVEVYIKNTDLLLISVQLTMLYKANNRFIHTKNK